MIALSIASAAVCTPGLLYAQSAADAVAGAGTIYAGPVQNGTYSGTMRLAIGTPAAGTGAVTATIAFSNGLSGDGQLTGTYRGTDLTLDGTVAVGSARHPLRLGARRGADGTLAGTYVVTVNGTPQRVSFSLAAARAATEITPYTANEVKPYVANEVKPNTANEVRPSTANEIQQFQASTVRRVTSLVPDPGTRVVVDPQIVGTWELSIPGVAYQRDDIVNNTRTSVVAPGGAALGTLTIAADGTWKWDRRGAVARGRLTAVRNADGSSLEQRYVGLINGTDRIAIYAADGGISIEGMESKLYWATAKRVR